MDFKLLRDPKPTADSWLGEFVGSGGVIYFSLERLFDGLPKLPCGVYDCEIYASPKFGYDVYIIKNVPGHDHIEIHIANEWEDLDGCVGIGLTRGVDVIYHSRDAFNEFMALQNKAPFKLTVE